MTISDFFSPTHLWQSGLSVTAVPLVDAFVYLPLIDSHISLQFLVDSGADKTVLNPHDSLRLLPDESQWKLLRASPSVQVGGAGAGLPHYTVRAAVVFIHENADLESIPLNIWVAEPGPQNVGLESLLGRDVLQHFETSFRGLDSVSLAPLSDDFTIRGTSTA